MTVEDGEYRSVDGPWAVARESFQGHACVPRLGGYHSTIHSKNLIAGESDKQSRSPQLPYDVGWCFGLLKPSIFSAVNA